MPEFHQRSDFDHPAEALFSWHERPGAFSRLAPPWERIRLVTGGEGIDEGSRTHFQLLRGPLALDWVAEHTDHQPGRSFTDRQVRGPFASWTHVHGVEPRGEDGSTLDDRITYSLPLPPFGPLSGGGYTRRTLARQFAWRHYRTARDLDRHAPWADQPRLHVAITGASGLVGSALVDFLRTGGHRVSRLVRRQAGPGEIHWDPARQEIDAAALEGVDAVVHLAGESIAERWTASKKERVLRSRVDGTDLLARALAGLERKPRVLVSASAMGFYGLSSSDEWLDESSPRGQGFLADVCVAWEQAADPAREAGIRVVHPRIGMVVSSAGGALAQLLPPFLMGAGGPVGSGRQWMSWIQRDDLVYAIHQALWEDHWEGPFNAATPTPVRNATFGRTLGKVLRRPALMPLPAFAIKLVFGEMGEAMLLEGARLRPGKLEEWGFEFTTPDLEEALRVETGRL